MKKSVEFFPLFAEGTFVPLFHPVELKFIGYRFFLMFPYVEYCVSLNSFENSHNLIHRGSLNSVERTPITVVEKTTFVRLFFP
jgi:hypothetical protein